MVPSLRARLRKTQGPAACSLTFSDPIRRHPRRRQIYRTRRAPTPPRRRLTRHRPVRLPRRRLRQQIPRSDDRVRAEPGLKLKHRASTGRASLPYRRRSLAGELGFEPRFSESESDVLPLNYSPFKPLQQLKIFQSFTKLPQKFYKFKRVPNAPLLQGASVFYHPPPRLQIRLQ